MTLRPSTAGSLVLGTLCLLLAAPARAQYNERPDPVGSPFVGVDSSGRSIKNRRVRAVHTTDPDLLGGTAYFLRRDPFLAYQLGRNLNFREFRERDGVLNGVVSGLRGPMPDGVTAKFTFNNQTSCAGCHGVPQGNPGAGINFHKDSGFGRNIPHYYGAGVVEMLALQVRAELMQQIDTDQNGWISVAEAQSAPSSVSVVTAGAHTLDFGNPRLNEGTTGRPRLNNILHVWFVDAQGRPVPRSTRVNGSTTVGYNFAVMVWGWGQGPRRSALNPTNRAFFIDAAFTHLGLDAYDPSTTDDPDGDGVSEPSLAGALQFPVVRRSLDSGQDLDPLGFSRQDPDRDGHLNEVSEGDLDLAEWFMLHAPRPAFEGTPAEYAAGLQLMDSMGCLECHVERWDIRPADGTFAGDRRLFDLEVTWDADQERLEGRLERLYTKVGQDHVPDHGGFSVVGLFSDLRHHDMGLGFREIDFGGVINTVWRTPPLWGVASTAPYGHDGRSLSLEQAIARHDGEGAAARDAWLAAGRDQRAELVAFLRRLVLYDLESLPADVDGDGVISPAFFVQGRDTGEERFNVEWLFEIPVLIQGLLLNPENKPVVSFVGMNVFDAYGETLEYRVDSDEDGWPDVWDHAPGTRGYKDGVHD